jgi:hypothetical protein
VTLSPVLCEPTIKIYTRLEKDELNENEGQSNFLQHVWTCINWLRRSRMERK